jgi:DNA mismatch endonuclease (patch repair protein)
MTDKISRKRRSENMRRIRSTGTIPEKAVQEIVKDLGLRYRLQSARLPGRPDIVFPSLQKAIFVHGCFWHLHGRCVDGRIPSSRQAYWEPKLLGNRQRDKRNRQRLTRMGWKSLVVWECQVARVESLTRRISDFARG